MLNLREIGHRIKMLRVDKDMTQGDLAKALECPQYKVSCWENGKLLISTVYLYKVSNFFRVNADYIMTGKELVAKRDSKVKSVICAEFDGR